MKKFLPLLLTLLLIPTPVQSQPTITNQVLKSVVSILGYEGDKNTSFCTGVVVWIDKAVTATHCVKDSESFKVDGKLSEILKINGDLALVTIVPGSKPSIEIQKYPSQIGDEVKTFGYAWGDMHVFHRAIAAKTSEDIIMDGSIAPGMSGGPVVDTKGKLIGINQGSSSVTSIARGVRAIRDILGLK